MSLAIECSTLAAAENEKPGEWEKLLSCGGKCDRKLPLCAHTCQEVCHAGECPKAEQCRKKVRFVVNFLSEFVKFRFRCLVGLCELG